MYRPFRRRALLWRVLGLVFVLIGLSIGLVVALNDAAAWRKLLGLGIGGAVCAGAGWMFLRAQRIGNSPLHVLRGSVRELIPGDYDLPSSIVMSVASAFSFGADGTTTPLPNRLGQQRISVLDYEVFKALSEGKANVADVQFLCLPDGAVISLLEEALRSSSSQ
jgi:hypothetical protein